MSDENMNPINTAPEEFAENSAPADETTPKTQPQNPPDAVPFEPHQETSPISTPEEMPFVNTPEIPAATPVEETNCQPAATQAQYIPQPPVPPYQPPYTQVPVQQPYQPPYQPPYTQQNTPYPPYQQPYQAPQGGYNPPPYTPHTPPYTPQYTPYQQPAPKKRSAGAKVMLICLWVLLGLFSLGFIGMCGYYIGTNNGETIDIFPEQWSDIFPDSGKPDSDNNDKTPANPDSDNNTDNSELFGEGEITLNNYPSDKSDISKYNTQSAFEKASPSAVGIMCYTDKNRTTPAGQGTGIIINTEGYIATNSHVIGDSKSAYYLDVILSDGNTYKAKVVGFDTRTDLAVIKITAENLTPAEFADSDQVSIGEDVIAIGNPGGMEFQNTLTRGVISAKDRTLDLSTQVKYIQTDAAINPGNSGGPLCNTCGQVIGINSAKIADADYEGMGFAIPSRTVKEVVDDLIKQGYVSGRVKIGVIGTAVTAQKAQLNNVPQGIEISEIVKGGPCDNGEIKKGDIVVALDEHEIKTFNDIYTALTNYKAGDKATVKVYRPSTDTYIETTVTLQADNGSESVE